MNKENSALKLVDKIIQFFDFKTSYITVKSSAL